MNKKFNKGDAKAGCAIGIIGGMIIGFYIGIDYGFIWGILSFIPLPVLGYFFNGYCWEGEYQTSLKENQKDETKKN